MEDDAVLLVEAGQQAGKFKAEIVQEVLQENKTIAEIASEHGIHPNQIYRWKEIDDCEQAG